MLKCKICGKEFDGCHECVAPCGHAFHMPSPTCPECKSAIDVNHVKTLSDHAVSSKTEKDQESEGKDQEIGAKDQEIGAKDQEIGAKDQEIGVKDHEIGVKDHEIGVKDQEIGVKDHEIGVKDQEIGVKDQEIEAKDVERADEESKDKEREGKDQEGESLDLENIPDPDESEAGVYDLSAYVETLEDRIKHCMDRMNELTAINETLDNKAAFLAKQNMDLGQANVCLRRQLHMLHNFQELNIASEDDFEKMIASISKEPDAVQKLMHYCTTLRKQLLRIRSGERPQNGTKCKRVRSGNLEEPCCSNQVNEQNSEMEEIITQDEFDLLNIESEVATGEPGCGNQTNEPSCEGENGIGQNEVEQSYAGGRDEACSSDAIEDAAELINVPLDANSSDVHMQDELK